MCQTETPKSKFYRILVRPKVRVLGTKYAFWGWTGISTYICIHTQHFWWSVVRISLLISQCDMYAQLTSWRTSSEVSMGCQFINFHICHQLIKCMEVWWNCSGQFTTEVIFQVERKCTSQSILGLDIKQLTVIRRIISSQYVPHDNQ